MISMRAGSCGHSIHEAQTLTNSNRTYRKKQNCTICVATRPLQFIQQSTTLMVAFVGYASRCNFVDGGVPATPVHQRLFGPPLAEGTVRSVIVVSWQSTTVSVDGIGAAANPGGSGNVADQKDGVIRGVEDNVTVHYQQFRRSS
jgi:hypothetical protein